MPGSIPACAGEPVEDGAGRITKRVYPRVCGGAHHSHTALIQNEGLSPRVRGSRINLPIGRIKIGSIPACAGEPSPTDTAYNSEGVYPRVCGGAAGCEISRSAPAGLSPRVRGSQAQKRDEHRRNGSIPACAGEPFYNRHRINNLRVYPRVCGGASTFYVDDIYANCQRAGGVGALALLADNGRRTSSMAS